MRNRTRFAILAACLTLALAPGAQAAEGQGPADEDVRLDRLGLGTYWYGQEISLDDLRGKVVLVEMWGS